MDRREFLRTTGLAVVSMLYTTSCSKQDRASRYIKESQKLEDEAIKNLISGNNAHAEDLSSRCLKYANKADILPTTHPFYNSCREQLGQAQMLYDSFSDPAAAVRLWWRAIGEGNTDLAVSLFDSKKTTALIYPAGSKELEEEFTKSLFLMYNKYLNTVSQLSIDTKVAEDNGKDAVVKVALSLPKQAQGMQIKGANFDLIVGYENSAMKLYDVRFSNDLSSTTVTEGLRGYGTLDEIIQLLKGRDLMEAFEGVQSLRDKSGYIRAEGKKYIGHNVTVIEDTECKKDGRIVVCKKGTIFKAISVGQKNGSETLIISTNEVDKSKAALGEVLISKILDQGTDDDTLWGVSLGKSN